MPLSLNKTISRLEEWGIYFFLITIPLQTRIVLYQSDWYFNEWRSIFLYATDILWFALMILWAIQKLSVADWKSIKLSKVDYALMVLMALAVLSIKNSSQVNLSWYALARLVQGITLFYYVRIYVWKKFEHWRMAGAIVIGGVLQAILGILQFIRQSDLGLRKLGESFLNIDLQGVAVFYNSAGEKILRAYGTLPHPNILAAYLLLALAAWYFLYFKYNQFSRWLWPAYGLLLFGFFLTFSRTTIAVWGLALLILIFWFRHLKITKKLILVTAGISIIFAVLFWDEVISRMTISSGDEAVSLRLYYGKTALGSGGHDLNWTGVGLGNFVSWFMQYRPNLSRVTYQPAHNIYLLIYSEMGILGIGSFLVFLYFLLRHKNKWSLLLISCFLLLGFFDHFPWTLQQGRLMFWLVLGLL